MINSVTQLQSIIKIVTLHTFFLSALMSIGMLLSNRKNVKNQIFFGLFLAFSFLILFFFLHELNLVKEYPYILVLSLPGLFLIGPMVYFLSLYAVNKTFEFTKKQYWHILPTITSTIIGIIAIYYYGYHYSPFYFNILGNKIILILGLLGSISFVTYMIMAGRILITNYLWNLNNLKNEPSALASFIIFDIFSIASISDILSVITNKYVYSQISILLLSICVIILFILNLIYPGFNVAINKVVEKEKHKRSYLSNINVDNLKLKIKELIHSDEIFTDENITLEKLASLLELSTHQVSEFINKYYNKNFTTFLNEFRVNKAKKLLIEKPEFTILAIAYEVGFHSKSAFNAAFRKITGITPTEFKNNNQNLNMS